MEASTACTQLVGTSTLVTERWLAGRSMKGRSGKGGGVSPWPSHTHTMPPRSTAV